MYEGMKERTFSCFPMKQQSLVSLYLFFFFLFLLSLCLSSCLLLSGLRMTAPVCLLILFSLLCFLFSFFLFSFLSHVSFSFFLFLDSVREQWFKSSFNSHPWTTRCDAFYSQASPWSVRCMYTPTTALCRTRESWEGPKEKTQTE